jgi:hypothetical protein
MMNRHAPQLPRRSGGFDLWPVWDLACRPRVRYALAWLVVLTASLLSLYFAWTAYDGTRTDGVPDNNGHAMIDFGGQWLMGRMIVRGHGRQLYHRNIQRGVLDEGYPLTDQDPLVRLSADEQKRLGDGTRQNQAEELMSWFMGADDAAAAAVVAGCAAPLAAPDPLSAAAVVAGGLGEWQADELRHVTDVRIGGPLYPPIHALLYAPLGLLHPPISYRVTQILVLLLAYVCGLAVCRLAEGRVWWPVATTAIIVYPGFSGAICLGQNPALSLAVILWGWVCLERGRSGWGGAVWGLLAFKPVWAVSFFLALVLSRRWRACAAMLAAAAGLAVATLPLVGLQTWLDWLAVGREAAELYDVD